MSVFVPFLFCDRDVRRAEGPSVRPAQGTALGWAPWGFRLTAIGIELTPREAISMLDDRFDGLTERLSLACSW